MKRHRLFRRMQIHSKNHSYLISKVHGFREATLLYDDRGFAMCTKQQTLIRRVCAYAIECNIQRYSHEHVPRLEFLRVNL